jgi:hypothetical protein
MALVSAATVGAVLASRRPRHPVGWLLLAEVISLLVTGAFAQYLAWGLVTPGRALPATRTVAVYYPASAGLGLVLLGFMLLLTPTGRLPSPRWRWWARAMVAVPLLLVVAVTLAPGSVEPYLQVVGGPFEFGGLGGPLLVADQLALAFTTLAVVVCAGSLVQRFRRAQGVERQQLRWVAVAAGLLVPAAGVALGGLAVGATAVVTWAISVCLGQLLGRDSSLVVAGATLAVAALFQPARRRIQAVVDRRFNRRRHDAAETIQAFGARLRDELDLDTLTAELLTVTERTMQPTQASLWLRSP